MYITPLQMFILLAVANFCAFMLDSVAAANYPGLLSLAVVNGISLGTMAVLLVLVARQVMEKARVSKAWGMMCASFAIGELAGGAGTGKERHPPIFAYYRD